MALAEAVLYEAAIMGKIQIDGNQNIHHSGRETTGHSIIDSVSDRIRTQSNRSFIYWTKQLSMSRQISMHVTQNLVDNNLLTEKRKGGLFRTRTREYFLKDRSVPHQIQKHLEAGMTSDEKNTRDEITRNLIVRYEV